MKNLIQNVRTKSVMTGSNKIEHLITIKKFPVFIGHTTESIENDLFADMIFDICKETGLIQLRNILKPDLIYSKYHSESIGNTWKNHQILLSDIINHIFKKEKISEPEILEIGGSNGKLASIILNKNAKIKNWTIIEPNICPSENFHKKIILMNSFFENIKILNKDIIIHSHTLEHIYDIHSFLSLIYQSLNKNGFHIFSIPNLYYFLKNKFINTINFEHTMFLTEEMTDYLLSKNKFQILDKIYYENHSIIYITKKLEHMIKCDIPNKYNEYKEMYIDCINYYKDFVLNINKKLEMFNGDVYLFGGHIFSQFLLNFGLNAKKIKLILDNSEIKNNTRLYGSHLKIKMPNQVNIKSGSAIILKVGTYRNEIIEALKKQNNNIIILE